MVITSLEERTVRVSRNGNSRTLSIPAGIVDQEQIEVGEVFRVEARPDGLFYRRVTERTHWYLAGEGNDRHVVIEGEMVSMAGDDPSPRPSLDWDY